MMIFDKDQVDCALCGDVLGDDDVRHTMDVPLGEKLCPDCFADAPECGVCGHKFIYTEMAEVEGWGRTCLICLEKHNAIMCEDCGEWFPEDRIASFPDTVCFPCKTAPGER